MIDKHTNELVKFLKEKSPEDTDYSELFFDGELKEFIKILKECSVILTEEDTTKMGFKIIQYLEDRIFLVKFSTKEGGTFCAIHYAESNKSYRIHFPYEEDYDKYYIISLEI